MLRSLGMLVGCVNKGFVMSKFLEDHDCFECTAASLDLAQAVAAMSAILEKLFTGAEMETRASEVCAEQTP